MIVCILIIALFLCVRQELMDYIMALVMLIKNIAHVIFSLLGNHLPLSTVPCWLKVLAKLGLTVLPTGDNQKKNSHGLTLHKPVHYIKTPKSCEESKSQSGMWCRDDLKYWAVKDAASKQTKRLEGMSDSKETQPKGLWILQAPPKTNSTYRLPPEKNTAEHWVQP